jgi:sigma-E factor negative regulatory protein RseB
MVLDAENSLLLRSELLSPNGIVIERFQYMLLEEQPAVGAAANSNSVESQITDHVNHSAPIAVAASRQLMLNAKWQPRWLPHGFLRADLDENPADGVSCTDGLGMFTLFIEPFDDDKVPQPNIPNVMRRGATLAYTQSIVQHGNTYRITAVGEVPLATLQQVVQSLKQKP